MISTFHGELPLLVYPQPQMHVTAAGRAEICRVRGEVLGQRVHLQVTLDLNTGELLLMSPDKFVGSFRLGDLVVAHVQQQLASAAQERRNAIGEGHAAALN